MSIRNAGRARDCRGRPVTVLDPFMLHLLRQSEGIPAETMHAIARDLGPGVKRSQWRWFWVFQVGPVAVTVGGLVLLAVGGAFTDTVGMVFWSTTALLSIVALLGFLHSTRRKRLQLVVEVMLRHCRCPQCGCDLRALPACPDDGATVCPECGGAWQRPCVRSL
ncbi:MAG: hypothetical protein JXB13_00060 [Phycisphaerae bacterium]|nr:hypothetical protein [Phycisphaerae bacterium]